jgi:hypothetical protein
LNQCRKVYHHRCCLELELEEEQSLLSEVEVPYEEQDGVQIFHQSFGEA